MERFIKPTYDELESYVENLQKQLADAQATIAALQARVQELEDGTSALLNQQSERLAVENEKLTMALSQLTQRTAELEVAKGKLDIILRVSRGEPDDELAVDYGGLGWENDPAVLGVYDLIAELKHVNGERDSALESRDWWQEQLDKEQAKLATTATSQPVPPYKEWCRHPEKCAGLASCPQDPTCAD